MSVRDSHVPMTVTEETTDPGYRAVPQYMHPQEMATVPNSRGGDEVLRYVSQQEYVSTPPEVIKFVPKVQVRQIEKIVEVPRIGGQVVQVSKPYIVEKEEPFYRYMDEEVECVVAQKMIPVVEASDEHTLEVEVNRYVPEIIPVDVYVPRPVSVPLIPVRKTPDEATRVNIPGPQYNTLLLNLNPHCAKDVRLAQDLPFKKNDDGTVPTLVGHPSLSRVTTLLKPSSQ